MSQWLSSQHRSRSIQLVATALISGIVTASFLYSFQFRRRSPVNTSINSTPLLSREQERTAALAARARRGDYDDELILEQLARNRVFLGEEGLEKLRDSFVIVVGLGGVGSHAVSALARSGVGKLRLIDFDQVTLASLNRHAVATLADVGTPKVLCMRRRLEQITPWVRLDCLNQLFHADTASKLLGEWDYELLEGEKGIKPDYVIDCIDNIDSKVALLHYCHQYGLKVISSMGAGCKSDPSRVTVGDISLSTDDPLSRSTRRRLRILGIHDQIPVVFSTEKPGPGKAELLPLDDEEFARGKVGELGVLPDFRVRILPVLGTMPAMFGYAAASHVICQVARYPVEYRVGDRGGEKMYAAILNGLQALEGRLVLHSTGEKVVGLRLPVNMDDVAYLVEEVFRGRSVVSGLTTRLALVRWKRPEKGFKVEGSWREEGQVFTSLELGDLVCMTKEEAKIHEKEVLKGDETPEDLYDREILDLVSMRQEEESHFSKYR